MKHLLLLCLMLVVGVSFARAQDNTPSQPIAYATTQDFSSLRTGPGRAFSRLVVVPPATTIPAYGRTADTSWVQVEYGGQVGWINSTLLVWSGDVIALPVDGVNPAPFVRRAAALGITTRDAPIYPSQIAMLPQYQSGMIPAGTTVELTGRVGERGYFRFQVRWEDNLYWIGSWDVRIIEGDYLRLLDLAYLYPYGRLVQSLQNNLAFTINSFRQITDVWQRLSRGDQIACQPVPLHVERTLTEADVLREPTFAPALVPLDQAVSQINGAISAFEDACADPSFVLTPQYIDAQLAALRDAERNLILVGSLLEPLRERNPLLDNDHSS
jgi:hypothetical protein